MKLCVIGTGYVGLVTGACFSDLGYHVVCVDIDEEKLSVLARGDVPFYEPGLSDILRRNVREKRLRFSSNTMESVQEAETVFICVGTPEGPSGEADLRYVLGVAGEIGKSLNGYKVIVVKSTVPVGTNEKVRRTIAKEAPDADFDVVSNPEFLREGAAVKDFQNPDRIVVGARTERARASMARLYKSLTRATRPLMLTTPENAEVIKYASNAMLAARISFVNELSHLCEAVGADIKEVAKGMGLDDRIGVRFLSAGAGYGGSCFPKDVRALAQTMEQHGTASNFLRAIDYINERQKRSLVPKLKKLLPELDGRRIAIWGLSFKPRTSDVRNSAALTVAMQLQDEYADVVVFDPEAMDEARKVLPQVTYARDAYAALDGADALIVCTEWDEFRVPDFERMKRLMRGAIVVDGRNILDPGEVRALGFQYVGIGR